MERSFNIFHGLMQLKEEFSFSCDNSKLNLKIAEDLVLQNVDFIDAFGHFKSLLASFSDVKEINITPTKSNRILDGN